MDVVDPDILQNDGMPRVAPPRNKTEDQNIISHSTNAAHIAIEIHGTYTTLFEEVDPFRIHLIIRRPHLVPAPASIRRVSHPSPSVHNQ